MDDLFKKVFWPISNCRGEKQKCQYSCINLLQQYNFFPKAHRIKHKLLLQSHLQIPTHVNLTKEQPNKQKVRQFKTQINTFSPNMDFRIEQRINFWNDQGTQAFINKIQNLEKQVDGLVPDYEEIKHEHIVKIQAKVVNYINQI